MNAKVKLGCLRDAEGLPTPFHVGGGGVSRSVETYQYTRLDLPLPAQGAEEAAVACPVCAVRLTLKLASPARFYELLQWVLLAWATVCLAMAAVVYLASLTSPGTFTLVAAGFAAVGAASFVAAWFSDRLPPSLFKGDLVTIGSDGVREQAQDAPRGHKILEVTLS